MNDTEHVSTFPETFSLVKGKLVWYLAREVMKRKDYMSDRPEIGDIVIEVTHLMGGAKQQIGSPFAFGRVIEIREHNDYDRDYRLLLWPEFVQYKVSPEVVHFNGS